MAPIVSANEIKVGQLDDIQELYKSKVKEVPERYVRETYERPDETLLLPNFGTVHEHNVPIIDMSKLLNNDEVEVKNELAKLADACQEWGFFQLINHGLEEEMLKTVEKVVRDFFALPLEEKQKYPMVPGTAHGYGHAFIFSEDQKLDWCNMMALAIEPLFIRNPNLWPVNPPYFNEIVESYSYRVRSLCQKLLEFVAMTLGLNPSVFNDLFGIGVQAVRMNYYPPCPQPDLVLGLSPHSDGSALTVLQQENHSAGLQIFKDGTWLPVLPIPNAFVINVGDTIEVLSNGCYKSVEHRTVTNSEKDRLSLVTFYAPAFAAFDIELGPMPELVTEEQPAKYKRYNHGEYSISYLANKLQGKKNLDFARI